VPVDSLSAGWFDSADGYEAVVWPTQRQLSDVEQRYGPHPNWFVVPHPARPVPGAELALADPGPVIVMVTRLAPVKGLDQALRIFAQVRAQIPAATLQIVGGGPLHDQLQALADELGVASAVEFTGWVPDPGRYLHRAAATLVTSVYEGYSLAVSEALEHAVPVVAFDLNYGPAQMITPGDNGELVPVGDIGAAAAALVRLLTDPARRAHQVAGARHWAATHGVDQTLAQFAAVVRYALDHPSRYRVPQSSSAG
jgi:glycosyltransferase involved in cell wall biosynthesis